MLNKKSTRRSKLQKDNSKPQDETKNIMARVQPTKKKTNVIKLKLPVKKELPSTTIVRKTTETKKKVPVKVPVKKEKDSTIMEVETVSSTETTTERTMVSEETTTPDKMMKKKDNGVKVVKVEQTISVPRKTKTKPRFPSGELLDNVPNTLAANEPCSLHKNPSSAGTPNIGTSRNQGRQSSTGNESGAGNNTGSGNNEPSQDDDSSLGFAFSVNSPVQYRQRPSSTGDFRGYEVFAYIMKEPSYNETCVLFRIIPTGGEFAKCFPAHRMGKLNKTFPDFCTRYHLHDEPTYYLNRDHVRVTNVSGCWIPLFPCRFQGEPEIADIRRFAELIATQLKKDPTFHSPINLRAAPIERFIISDEMKWVDLIGITDTIRYLTTQRGEPVRDESTEYYEKNHAWIWACFHKGQTDHDINTRFGIPECGEGEQNEGNEDDNEGNDEQSHCDGDGNNTDIEEDED